GVRDVVVVGAGVIGCSIARELARRGAGVIVLERDVPGRGATWAAGGMLSPLTEASEGGPLLELGDESLRLYPAFAAALLGETGIDVEYRTGGKLEASLHGADAGLRSFAASPLAARFESVLMDGDAARRLEPSLSAHVTAAVLVERDHRINNRLLAEATSAAARSAGAVLRTGCAVEALLIREGAVTGVRLASGEEIDAGTVVLAAGAWSAKLEGLPRRLPVVPVRGQMFAVDTHAAAWPHALPGRVLAAADCYIIPREDGRLVIGATVEHAGFAAGPTPYGIAALLTAAIAVVPAVAELPLVETWSGFRPGTPDDLPIIGADADVRGLIYATGHYRNGILLAPITAHCIAALLSGDAPPVLIDPFSIERF
ncbi:MAG: glycine oxidase ThiO, partial [Gemmatimonadota bacterium]